MQNSPTDNIRCFKVCQNSCRNNVELSHIQSSHVKSFPTKVFIFFTPVSHCICLAFFILSFISCLSSCTIVDSWLQARSHFVHELSTVLFQFYSFCCLFSVY